MARIGVDLDGVLFNFGAALREYMVDQLSWGRSNCPDPEEWHFYRNWGLTDEGFLNICNRAASRGELWNNKSGDSFTTSYTANNPVDALHDLRNAGHTLHIITDRSFGNHPGQSQEATAAWLRRHKMPYDTLTFSRDKTIVTTDYMIDDRVENYDALTETVCTPYLLDRPWNADRDGYVRDRVSTVREFADLILDAKKAAA